MSPSALLNESRGKRVCGRFRSVNSHAEQERFGLSRLETVQVCYSQWRSANKSGSNSVCQRIGFVRGRKAPRRYAGTASQSVPKLFEEHGDSYEWTSGQLPHLVKNGRRIRCSTENHVPIVVPELSTGSFSSTTKQVYKIVTAGLGSVNRVQVVRHGETCCDPENPPKKLKIRTPIKYGETRCATFLNGWKISQRILWTDGFRPLRDAPASSSCESETAAPKEVVLGKHSVYTHFRKDRSFEIRKRTKNTRARCRKRTGKAKRRAENVGHLITADHKVLSEGCESRHNHRYAVVVQDLATQRIEAYPSKMKNSQETEKSLRNFLEP